MVEICKITVRRSSVLDAEINKSYASFVISAGNSAPVQYNSCHLKLARMDFKRKFLICHLAGIILYTLSRADLDRSHRCILQRRNQQLQLNCPKFLSCTQGDLHRCRTNQIQVHKEQFRLLKKKKANTRG